MTYGPLGSVDNNRFERRFILCTFSAITIINNEGFNYTTLIQASKNIIEAKYLLNNCCFLMGFNFLRMKDSC